MIAPNISTQPRISLSAQTLSQGSAIRRHRDTGFETEDQRGYGRIHVFLTDDLQSVGNTAGQDSGIEERGFWQQECH